MLKSEETSYPPHRMGCFIDGISDSFSSDTRDTVPTSPFAFQIPLLIPPGLSSGGFFSLPKDYISLSLPRFLFFRSNIK